VLLASLTGSITSFVGDHGVYAIFLLMLVAAVLPVGSELVMLYAGAVASGSLGVQATVFGHEARPFTAYLAFCIAAVAGNVTGAALGFKLGAWGGRPFVERYGRFIHVTVAKLDRTEAWLERYELIAVPLGFASPLLRSFVAIPAGIVRVPFGRFMVGALVGCSAFAFGVGAVGWAVGASYEKLHGDFRYVEVGIVLVVVAALVGWWVLRRRRATTLAPRADSAD
jgi:membrane protein DedA with SNARE-associated domain